MRSVVNRSDNALGHHSSDWIELFHPVRYHPEIPRFGCPQRDRNTPLKPRKPVSSSYRNNEHGIPQVEQIFEWLISQLVQLDCTYVDRLGPRDRVKSIARKADSSPGIFDSGPRQRRVQVITSIEGLNQLQGFSGRVGVK